MLSDKGSSSQKSRRHSPPAAVVACPRCRGRVELHKRGAALLLGSCSRCARSFGMLK